MIILSQIVVMPCSADGSALRSYKSVCAKAHQLHHLVRSFPIGHELTVFTYACDSFSLAKLQITDHDGMEFDRAIMEPYNADFAKCLSEEGVTSNQGE